MTADEVLAGVWQFIDSHVSGMDNGEYTQMLFELASDARIRAEACEQDALDQEHDD